jgi:hypothetical protein
MSMGNYILTFVTFEFGSFARWVVSELTLTTSWMVKNMDQEDVMLQVC